MPYMLYSQYKAAVADGYRERSASEIRHHAQRAGDCRDWLQSLDISPAVRDGLVEQINAIQEAFEEILRSPE